MRRVRALAQYAVLAACAALVAVSGCASDVTGSTHEPAVAIMRLNVGNTVISVDNKGETTGGPIVLRAGIAVNVTAEFLDANGESLSGVVPALYQVNAVQSGPTTITFTRSLTNPFAGIIECDLPNVTANMLFSLYNLDKQHDLWGPFDVQFTVSN